MAAGRIEVGTSSWADPGFIADWYPPGLPARGRLPWYAEHFDAVELNSSFYAVPGAATVERWAAVTPAGFTFDVKLHRLLSRHAASLESLPPQLRGGAQVVGRGRVRLTAELEAAMVDAMLAAVAPLVEAGKLSSFLLQLTPAFTPREHEVDELEGIVEGLRPHPVAIELRHRGWVEGERAQRTFAALSDMGAVFVGVDAPPGRHVPIMPPVDAVTSERMAYLRAHGRNTEGYLHGKTVAERFGWVYSDAELAEMRERAERLAREVAVVRVMFNNNRSANAPQSGSRFRELLGQVPAGHAGQGEAAAAGRQLRLA